MISIPNLFLIGLLTVQHQQSLVDENNPAWQCGLIHNIVTTNHKRFDLVPLEDQFYLLSVYYECDRRRFYRSVPK